MSTFYTRLPRSLNRNYQQPAQVLLVHDFTPEVCRKSSLVLNTGIYKNIYRKLIVLLFNSIYLLRLTHFHNLSSPQILEWDMSDHQWQRKKRAIETASGFVAVSNNTANDLRRFASDRFQLGVVSREDGLKIIPPPVVVGYNRISANRVAQDVHQLPLNKLGLPPGEKYILFVGNRAGYKGAYSAYEELRQFPVFVESQSISGHGIGTRPTLESTSDGKSDLFLLLVGGPPVKEEERKLLKDLRYKHVYLTDEELTQVLYCAYIFKPTILCSMKVQV